VEKAIFSIHCTTCRARLAVRSEAAIGAILECPQCQSMVQVLPPPGWKPAAESEAASVSPAGPPPLDRVAAAPLKLDLDLAETSFFGGLLGRKWTLWGAASLATIGAIVLIVWLASPRSESESASSETATEAVSEIPAIVVAATEKKPAPQEPPSETATKPEPAKPVAKKSEPAPPPDKASSSPSKPAEVKPQPAEPLPSTAEAATNGKPAESAQSVEIKRALPAPVDVPARLNDPVAQLELADMPLGKAMDLLTSMGALPTTIDADALMKSGVTLRDPVSLRLSATTVGKAMQAVAAEKGLIVAVENGQVLVTSPVDYRETLRTVRYTVADLTGEDKTAMTELAALIRKFVAPDSWHGNSGRGTIDPNQTALVVTQTGEVHRQVLVFCEKLRNARGKPLRSRGDPAEFTLITHATQAREMLARPVTANFHEPTPLAKVLAYLAAAAKCDILVDRAALAAAETSDRVEATLAANRISLASALGDLLRPLGLAYRAVGADVLQITTKEVAEERLELEFYPVGLNVKEPTSPRPLAGEGPGVRAAALVDSLKTRVSPSNWSEAGGSGEIYFDPPSQCLIVLQSQSIQAAVERFLTEKDTHPNESKRGSR
jgi:hypothetical protein